MTQSDWPGQFFTLEGVDGCGKSTQARLLATHLREAGRNVVLTREPGGSPGAEEIRKLLVEGNPARWSAETETLLFTAARRDHWERTIHPALQSGATVVCDRFVDSTRVYQGSTRGDLTDTVDKLHELMIGAMPNLTLVIDVEPSQAHARALGRSDTEDRFEEFGASFQDKLREGFIALARNEPERVVLVDGSGTPEEVSKRVLSTLSVTSA